MNFTPEIKLKYEWKVEWLDREGRGHIAKFDFEAEVKACMALMEKSELCAMLGVYRRQVTEWERGVV
jgi:hypothetical protein